MLYNVKNVRRVMIIFFFFLYMWERTSILKMVKNKNHLIKINRYIFRIL